MGVLEKFLILFESDADKAHKDVDKLDKSLDETEKSAIGATEAADNTNKQFVAMGTKAIAAVGGVVALTAAIAGLVMETKRIDELKKFSDLIGENIEEVDAWGGAVVRAGGTVDGFRGTIESLNEKMVDASIRGFNEITPFFNQLGISIVDSNGKLKKTLDILPELADSFSRISKEKSLGIGKKLGLDINTIALLQQGTGAIDKLIERQKMLGLTSDKAGKLSAEFVDIMADFKQITGFAAQGLLLNFLPAIIGTIDKLIDLSIWARENKPIVIGFFLGVGAVAIPMLYSLASAGWAAIAPFLVMAAPFLAIAAAAAAVGIAISLVVEDIMAFLDGQDSLLGEIAKKWPVVGEFVKSVASDVKIFVEMMKDFAKFLLDVFLNPTRALKSLKNAFGNVKSFFGFGDDEKKIDLNKNITIGQGSIDLASNSPIASQTSSSISNVNNAQSRNTSVQVGDLTIQTQATDSDGIAKDIGGSLRDEMSTTVDNFDDGILI